MRYIITYTTGNKKQFPITRFIKQKHHLLPKANKMFLVSCVICICLMLSVTAVMPSSVQTADAKAVNADMADEKTGSAWFTCRQVTVIKGQYAFIGLRLNGINSNAKIKWIVPEGKLKLDKKSRYNDERAYCYIKALKTGTWTLKCSINEKTLKCKIKVLQKAGFIGDFCDDAGEAYLDISKNGKEYVAHYGQVKLCAMENLKGSVKNGVLTLKGDDPGGNPITVTVSRKGKKRVFTLKKTVWSYFTQGSSIVLEKCSGKEGYDQALYGNYRNYDSYK